MSGHLLLAPLLESYLRRPLTKQRNATPATVASYRDALRILILFAAARLRKRPAALTLEDLDRDLVLAFLDELEEKRNNSVATRNARLSAIRSFFHHVAAADPASFGVAQRVLTIPIKRAHIGGDAPSHQGRSGHPHRGARSKDAPWSARPSLSGVRTRAVQNLALRANGS
ncbi:site-specific integrase [Mesorhizobium kowhaii]